MLQNILKEIKIKNSEELGLETDLRELLLIIKLESVELIKTEIELIKEIKTNNCKTKKSKLYEIRNELIKNQNLEEKINLILYSIDKEVEISFSDLIEINETLNEFNKFINLTNLSESIKVNNDNSLTEEIIQNIPYVKYDKKVEAFLYYSMKNYGGLPYRVINKFFPINRNTFNKYILHTQEAIDSVLNDSNKNNLIEGDKNDF